MDDYSIGAVQADEFDVANQIVYSSSPGERGALVRSSNSSKSEPLLTYFDPESDHIVLVTFEKDKCILGARKNLIAALFQNWKLPRAAINHLVSPEEPQGFFTASTRSIHCCWYHVPVERLNNKFEHCTLHVWQVLDVNSSRVRVLIMYPLFMKADMIAVLPSFFADTSGHENLQWAQIHLILIQTAIATWQRSRWAVMSLGSMSLRGLVVAVDKALDASPIKGCNESLSRLNLNISYMLKLKALIEATSQYFERELPNLDATAVHPTRMYIQNFQNSITFLLDSYEFLRDQLLLSRHTLTTSIEIKNASYMRANTIALRRIAEQNQVDVQQAKKQAELSQKNSQSMTKIAYLTMFYLPANFIATFFSMPFLNLDASQNFSNLGKIWIYVVTSIVSTVMTFLVSIAWDKYPIGLGSQSKLTSGESELVNNDIKVLEPTHHDEPGPDELIKQVIAVLNKSDDNTHQNHSNMTSHPSPAAEQDHGEDSDL